MPSKVRSAKKESKVQAHPAAPKTEVPERRTEAPAAVAQKGSPGSAERGLDPVERVMEKAADRLWQVFQRRAYVGVTLAAGLGVGVAMLLGPGEAAIGLTIGYAAYLVLRRHLAPSEALGDIFGVETGPGRESHRDGD